MNGFELYRELKKINDKGIFLTACEMYSDDIYSAILMEKSVYSKTNLKWS
jgi:hypothetical protein